MQHSEFFNDMNRQVENLISGHRVNDETVFTSADAKEWKRIVQAINEQEKQIAADLAEQLEIIAVSWNAAIGHAQTAYKDIMLLCGQISGDGVVFKGDVFNGVTVPEQGQKTPLFIRPDETGVYHWAED